MGQEGWRGAELQNHGQGFPLARGINAGLLGNVTAWGLLKPFKKWLSTRAANTEGCLLLSLKRTNRLLQ